MATIRYTFTLFGPRSSREDLAAPVYDWLFTGEITSNATQQTTIPWPPGAPASCAIEFEVTAGTTRCWLNGRPASSTGFRTFGTGQGAVVMATADKPPSFQDL